MFCPIYLCVVNRFLIIYIWCMMRMQMSFSTRIILVMSIHVNARGVIALGNTRTTFLGVKGFTSCGGRIRSG